MAPPVTAPAPALPKIPTGFLTPDSSLTPAVAGGIVLIIVNTLGAVFGLPRAPVGLLLSGLIGALIVSKIQGPITTRAIYWVVNSLTIFAVAFGATGVLTALTTEQPALAAPPTTRFLAPWD